MTIEGATNGNLAIVVAILLTANGCSTMSAGRKAVLDQYQRAIQEMSLPVSSDISTGKVENNYSVSLPDSVADVLKPKLDSSIPEKNAIDMSRRFDVRVDNLPVKTFLLSLVKGTELNIVPHPELQGSISLDLKNVTVEEVLAKISNAYGYGYDVSRTGFEVYKPKLRSKVYHIDYLNIRRYGKSQVKVSSGQISEKQDKQTQSVVPAGTQKKSVANSLSGTEVNTISDNTFWDELHRSVTTIIGEGDGKSVVINAHSGVIIVRAMPRELRRVEKFLGMTQSIIARQVLLEAKIIEVELSESHQTGINWSAFADKRSSSVILGQTGGGQLLNGSGVSEISGNNGDLNPQTYLPLNGTQASAFGGVFSMALKTRNFASFIEALETQGDVHVLSSPRVSTINNQKAVIKVGSDEFFVTGVRTETVTNNSTSQSVNVDITPFFSGVALDVTPQINAKDMVTLHVHPSVSNVREKVKQITVSNTDSFGIPLALSSIRESDSIVQAQSGQVIVIGGLMQNSINDNNAGVPLLRDIPLFGGLFRHEKNTRRKSELVILLRPIVIKNGKQWDSLVQAQAMENTTRR